jgi:hypothetical protein
LRALRRQELALVRLMVAAEESRLDAGHPQALQLSRPNPSWRWSAVFVAPPTMCTVRPLRIT